LRGIAPQSERHYVVYCQPTAQPFSQFRSCHFAAGTLTALDSQPRVSFHGCLEGPVQLMTTTGACELDAGAFLLLAPGLLYQWQNDGFSPVSTMSFIIDTAGAVAWPAEAGLAACCRELHRLVRGVHRFHVASDAELQQVFWQLADHLMAEPSSALAVTTGLLLTLVGLLPDRLRPQAEAASAPPAAARQIERMLLARVGGRLSIREVSDQVGLSPSRAKQVFRAAHGCGIMTYFNRLKVQQAKRLLCDLALTVDQVSQRLGFSSASYFSRVFHQHTGQSPCAFRAAAARKARR
jgi:AraC-like DNA-binding protein